MCYSSFLSLSETRKESVSLYRTEGILVPVLDMILNINNELEKVLYRLRSLLPILLINISKIFEVDSAKSNKIKSLGGRKYNI